MSLLEFDVDLDAALQAVERTGYYLLSSRYDAGFCQRVCDFVDGHSDDDADINYGGTEKRVWMAHEKDVDVAAFRRFADDLLTRLYNRQVVSRDILAIRNRPVPDTATLVRGRWHLDSLRGQIKVFAFLTDVTDRTGPLEIIPASHRPWFKTRHVVDGQLIRPTDFLGDARKYQSLDDQWIDRVVADAGGAHPFTCTAGSVFIVDTSAVHRARPCLEGERYALTAYYDHF